ncbi:MAG: hypothetical protein WBD07_18485 [Vicinamibacterales bacterium]
MNGTDKAAAVTSRATTAVLRTIGAVSPYVPANIKRAEAVGRAVLFATVTLAACSPGPDQAGRTVDLGACLAMARKAAEPSEALCPEIIRRGLVEMTATCADVGGRLEPAERPSLASLDVNGDGNAELLYDATENFRCDGAPSVFSCGSLGCPVSLFERQAGGWTLIGAISAKDAPALEALTPEPGARYGRLRGGCAGDRPCEEWTYYRWDGGAYQGTAIDVRGHWVDTANGGGLWTLVKDTPLLATPSQDAAVLERYPMGTEVVLIGDARGAPYKYVSPCNACTSGFVDPAALGKTN